MIPAPPFIIAGILLGIGGLVWLVSTVHRIVRPEKYITGDLTGGNVVGRNHNVGTISINGQNFNGQNLSIVGGRIIVDGQDVTDQTGVDVKSILNVKVTGDVQNVVCEKGLTVVGNIAGSVNAQGSVSCDNVGGDVRSSGAVSCDDVRGNVHAAGAVSCDDVGGSVTAGGRVSHG